jgi:hypothetical protein
LMDSKVFQVSKVREVLLDLKVLKVMQVRRSRLKVVLQTMLHY